MKKYAHNFFEIFVQGKYNGIQYGNNEKDAIKRFLLNSKIKQTDVFARAINMYRE